MTIRRRLNVRLALLALGILVALLVLAGAIRSSSTTPFHWAEGWIDGRS